MLTVLHKYCNFFEMVGKRVKQTPTTRSTTSSKARCGLAADCFVDASATLIPRCFLPSRTE
ncbi:hypothetical protein BD309DRAFT_973103 [Dichomitus squalens]|nr:hypothetical protein BD309DRAFT_973103 [Dichomitus squalens]